MRISNLHLVANPCTFASRVMKQTKALAASGLFETVPICAEGYHPDAVDLPEYETIDSQRQLWRQRRVWSHALPQGWAVFGLVKRVERGIRRILHYPELRGGVFTGHSLDGLRRAALMKAVLGGYVVYDAHELETETNGLRGRRKLEFKALEYFLMRRCDLVVCVSDTIADWYENEYGLTRPLVVRNIPDLRVQSGAADPGILRRRFGIPDDAIVFIYQGGLFKGRRIEQFIRVFARARPDRHLVFMGYGDRESIAREAAARHPNIHFLPAVAPEEVLRHTAGADVGLTGVENVCLSYFYSLPNKLFEYLAAGVPFLVPEFPEMQQLVNRERCGWIVVGDDDAWLERINRMTRQEVEEGRQAARVTAPKFSWANEERKLLEGYRAMLGATGVGTGTAVGGTRIPGSP